MNFLTFSLIICTRNRPRLLQRALRGVARLRYPAFELIVICDPEDPETLDCLARQTLAPRIGHCATANLAKARNVGLSMARGEIIAFLDDDSLPNPNWLKELAAAYANAEIAAAGGYIRAQNGLTFQSRIVLIDPFGGDHHRSRVPRLLPPGWFLSLTGTNFSVRRASAATLQGFDENYAYYLEETDFLLRLQQIGGQVQIANGAEVRHAYAENDVRSKTGAPRSFRTIARSKAYFCHINRQPGTMDASISQALATFVDQKRRQLWRHRATRRLQAEGMTKLLADLQLGLAEGEALAKRGRRLSPFPALDIPGLSAQTLDLSPDRP